MDIQKWKDEGFTFEQIQELEKRFEMIENGTATFISHEEFWDEVTNRINAKMMNQA
ncbi:hypothetical protein KGV52_01335 [Candidatus Gracilibacteria bacterium]|nr:hypothetical protein [Candidatus Gracilibacteria bacterium]